MLHFDPIFSVPALSRWLPSLASGMTGFAVAVLYYSSDFHEVSGACLSAALLWIAVAHVQNIMEARADTADTASTITDEER